MTFLKKNFMKICQNIKLGINLNPLKMINNVHISKTLLSVSWYADPAPGGPDELPLDHGQPHQPAQEQHLQNEKQ